jgi:hypothetical protein
MIQLQQQEIVSQYLDEVVTGKKQKQSTSKWAAKIELSKQYSQDELINKETEYYNRQNRYNESK